MKNLDCRGLACPGPVIQVKKVLEETPEGRSFSIDLDSQVSKDNVTRFAKSRGAEVVVDEASDGTIRLIITVPTKGDTETNLRQGYGRQARRHGGMADKQPVVLITAETLGSGDDKLGRILMEGFINTLPEQDSIPDRIFLMNTGVKLATEGSVVLPNLRKLTDQGCEILVCGTCLDFFGIMDKLAVGTVSNMYDIQQALLTASSIVSP